MTITPSCKVQCSATVTPSQTHTSGKYTVGMDSYNLTVPAAADIIVSRTLTCTSGAEVYEPDINSYDAEGTQLNQDLAAVALDTVYGIVVENNDASIVVTVTTNSELGTTSQALAGGAILCLYNMTGWTVTTSATITLTAASGSPTCDVVILGKNA